MNPFEWLRRALLVWRGVFSLLLCVIFSSVLLSQDRTGKVVFHDVMVSTLLYPLQASLSHFEGTLRVYHENEKLRRENMAFRTENDLLKQSLERFPRLQEMGRFQAAVTIRLKAGQIIAEDAGRLQRTWVLDLGRADSVDVNMPVMTSQGIVGKIGKCFSHHSLVQLLSDPEFKVSVQVDRSRARGILEPRGSSRFDVQFPAGSDVRSGDTLITAGLGGVFPKGLRVGKVIRDISDQEEQNYDVIRTFQVEPYQSLNSVEEVFVLIKNDQWNIGDIP